MQKLKQMVTKHMVELNARPVIVIDKDAVDKHVKQNTTTLPNASIVEADSSTDQSSTAHATASPNASGFDADDESTATGNSSAQNASKIVIDSDDENDDDVLFVKQYKRLTISPRSKYAALKKKLDDLKQQIVEAQSQLYSMRHAARTEQDASLILSPAQEAWINTELKNLMDDGQLENVFNDIMEIDE